LQTAVLSHPADTLDLIADCGCTAAIFDLDGVVTRTTHLHVRAWQRALDEFLRQAAPAAALFDPNVDYPRHLDGRTRMEGLRQFLASRDIDLPAGQDDDARFISLAGLGTYKNSLYLQALETSGIDTYADAIAFVERLRRRSYPIALATSSKNAPLILARTGLGDLFDLVIDGNVTERLGLRSKPAPDIFIHAADQLGRPLRECAVFEDTVAVLDGLAGLAPGCAVAVVRDGRRYAGGNFHIIEGFHG